MLRDVAILEAMDADGNLVEKLQLSLESYYEDLHPLFDDADYIAARRVRVVRIRLIDGEGADSQVGENTYDTAGNLKRSTVRFADGTTHDNRF